MTGVSETKETRDATATPRRRAGLRAEVGPTLRLAWPVVLTELGWMAMGVVDLVMVGRLGSESIAAVGLANIAFFAVAVFGLGLVMGLDTVVSQAFGAGRVEDCTRWAIQGLLLGLIVSIPTVGGILLAGSALPALGIAPAVAGPARRCLAILAWSLPPLMVFHALRRSLQAINVVGAVTWILLAANLLNFAGNWLLIDGRHGVAGLGVAGSAWATLVARGGLMVGLVAVAARTARRLDLRPRWEDWLLDRARLAALVRLGAPIAGQYALEVGVFALAALGAGRLGAEALAAHEVVLNVASVTFMVPLGIASAGAVRVGQAIGRRDPEGAARAGWVALALGAAFMLAAGLTLVCSPRPILQAFTRERAVIAAALPLLAAAALFQIFDGLQVVAGGALRGSGDTRTPLLVNLAAHWTIGLPIGFLLAFPARLGVVGLWIGLSAGLVCAGSFLLACWTRAVRRLGERAVAG